MGEVILLPKKLRAEWSDLLALDLRVTPTELRIAMIISSHFSRHSGATYIGLDTLARLSGMNRKTVWRAIQRLKVLGYLKVGGRELGFRSDGRRVRGGRGVANTYEPALDRQKLTSELGIKVVTRAHLYWEERWASESLKVGTHAHPTLDDPSDHNPSRAKAAKCPGATQQAFRGSKDTYGVEVHQGEQLFDDLLKHFDETGATFRAGLMREAARDGKPYLADPTIVRALQARCPALRFVNARGA